MDVMEQHGITVVAKRGDWALATPLTRTPRAPGKAPPRKPRLPVRTPPRRWRASPASPVGSWLWPLGGPRRHAERQPAGVVGRGTRPRRSQALRSLCVRGVQPPRFATGEHEQQAAAHERLQGGALLQHRSAQGGRAGAPAEAHADAHLHCWPFRGDAHRCWRCAAMPLRPPKRLMLRTCPPPHQHLAVPFRMS